MGACSLRSPSAPCGQSSPAHVGVGLPEPPPAGIALLQLPLQAPRYKTAGEAISGRVTHSLEGREGRRGQPGTATSEKVTAVYRKSHESYSPRADSEPSGEAAAVLTVDPRHASRTDDISQNSLQQKLPKHRGAAQTAHRPGCWQPRAPGSPRRSTQHLPRPQSGARPPQTPGSTRATLPGMLGGCEAALRQAFGGKGARQRDPLPPSSTSPSAGLAQGASGSDGAFAAALAA